MAGYYNTLARKAHLGLSQHAAFRLLVGANLGDPGELGEKVERTK